MTAALLASIRDIVGAENVLIDDDARAKYGTDWTRFYSPAPLAVVLARSVAQLVELVRFAGEQRLSLVPSGGRTGLSGGAVACNGELVVSFEKMDRVLDFNEIDETVTVEPGVITATLQSFAEEKGLYYPVDFASAGSSQIGGNIATNAGGIRVVRYGLTRDQVTGLKVVTGRGDILELNHGLIKNATGYDLRHLFIGSEGTLGFIVEATIRLTRAPIDPAVVLLSVPKMTDVISIMQVFKRRLTLLAFEFFSDKALHHVMARHGLAAPLETRADYYALIEFDQSEGDALDEAMAAFEACVEGALATDGVVSRHERQRKDLWKFREYISESITPFTPYKNDIAVRISQVPEFLAAIEKAVNASYPDFEIIWFGHIGDGNVHLNIIKPDAWSIDDFKSECEKVSEEVMAIVERFEGSISAEHGVGLLKREQLIFSRSQAEIEMMRAVKHVFDPNGIMNPGKLLR